MSTKSTEWIFVQFVLNKPGSVLTIPMTVVSMLYHSHESWLMNTDLEPGRAVEYVLHFMPEESGFHC